MQVRGFCGRCHGTLPIDGGERASAAAAVNRSMTTMTPPQRGQFHTEAFLAGDIHFTDIPRTIEAVLQATSESHPGSIEDVLALDEHAREVSRSLLARSSLAGAGRIQ